jgi:hypothetical protein
VTRKQRIADLEAENVELSAFTERSRRELAAHRKILQAIFAEHPPMPVTARSGVHIELRCKRCQTDEHHTWANDNHVPWPCPTLAPFVQYAVYEPQGEQEPAE